MVSPSSASPVAPSAAPATQIHVAEKVVDAILESAIIAFAAFTVLYYAARVFGWSVDLTLALWVPATTVGCVGLVGRSNPGSGSATRPARGPTSAVAVAALALGLCAGLFVIDVPLWWLWWIAVSAALLAGLVLVVRAHRVGDIAAPRVPGAAIAVVLVAAALAGALSAIVVRPDADDVLLVNRSVWIEERGGTFPERDVLFSDEVFALSRPDQIEPSFESFVGAISRPLPWSATTVTYLIVGPFVAALSVLALFRLNRALFVALPVVATLGALVLLAFSGHVHTSYGNFSFGRSWQGKTALLAVVVPAMAAFGLALGRRGSRRSAALLVAANIAAVGASTTAVVIAPVITVVSVVAAAGEHRRRWLLAIPAVAVPIGAGLLAVVRDRQSVEPMLTMLLAAGDGLVAQAGRLPPLDGTAGLDPPDVWYTVMGSGTIAAVGSAAALTAWVAAADDAARRFLLGSPLAVALVFFPPGVLRLIEGQAPTGSILWRAMWIIPVATGFGVWICAIAGTRVRDRLVGPVLAALVVLGVVVAGTPVWSTGNGAEVGRPAWDVDADSLVAARRLVDLAGEGAIVAAPEEVGGAIAVQTTRVRAVNPRESYTRGQHAVEEFDARDRRLLTRAVEHGGIDAANLGVVEGALANLGVTAACVRPTLAGDIAEVALAAQGFVVVDEDANCRYWLADT